MDTKNYGNNRYRGEACIRHIGETLHSSYPVLTSDEDQPLVMELHIGFDSSQSLTVVADLYDYDDPSYNCSTAVVVNRDDALAMAHRHRVRYTQLPRYISECMEEWDEIRLPVIRDVRACMKEITDCLIDEGCRIRIRRTYGPHGYQCF